MSACFPMHAESASGEIDTSLTVTTCCSNVTPSGFNLKIFIFYINATPSGLQAQLSKLHLSLYFISKFSNFQISKLAEFPN
jgi:hypothetical protein